MTTDTRHLGRFDTDLFADGEQALSTYYAEGWDHDSHFSGSRFLSVGDNDPDEIISDDLVAVTQLSIKVGTGRGSVRPQHLTAIIDQRQRITEILREIPADLPITDLDEPSATELLTWDVDLDRPVRALYVLLRRNLGTPSKPGRVFVYKLLARKRPHLLPVRDSVVEKQVDFVSPHPWWLPWWRSLDASPDVVERLHQLRESAEATQSLPLLRIADVCHWMRGR